MRGGCGRRGAHAGSRRELCLVEERVSILRRQDGGHRRARLWILDQRRYRLALVRSERSDIDQPRDLRIIARVRDHGSTVRVADQNHRTVLRGNRPLRDCHVICERGGWILDDGDRLALLLQDFVDGFPTGSVHETPVN